MALRGTSFFINKRRKDGDGQVSEVKGRKWLSWTDQGKREMKIISVNDNTYVRHWFKWYLMIKAGKHGDYAIVRPSRKKAR